MQKHINHALPAHASLFTEPAPQFKLPPLEQTPIEDAYDEIELLGFPLCNVWEMIDVDLSMYCRSKDLENNLGKQVRTIGYFITDKQVRTIKGQSMYFGTFLDKDGDWLDTVHFPGSFQWQPFEGAGFYDMQGKVVQEFGVYSVEVASCYKVGIKKVCDE